MQATAPAVGRNRSPQTTPIDLSGQKFGRLVAHSYVGPSAAGAVWFCVCDCGGSSKTTITKLRSGHTKSCGCLKLELSSKRLTTHGKADSSAYAVWGQMRSRCSNQSNAAYKDYGGRGIFVCPRWDIGDGERSGFECFSADMGERPSPNHCIERIDNDGPYEPGNCRWATPKDQARNRRSNRLVHVDGIQMSVAEACEKLGFNHNFINNRLQKGFSWQRAITQPKRAW